MSYLSVGGVEVSKLIFHVVEQKVLPGTSLSNEEFWASFAAIVKDLAPRNAELLKIRDVLQSKIDGWYKSHAAQDCNSSELLIKHRQFLSEIGYLVKDQGPLQVAVNRVDAEIAQISSPQLVVPIDNARYALNACNSRWGSLFDALYGFDVISEDGGAEKGKGYNPIRGDKVVAFANQFLDETAPLSAGSWKDVSSVWVEMVAGKYALVAVIKGQRVGLAAPELLKGFAGTASLGRLLLQHNDLHFIIEIDRGHPVGQRNPSGIKDLTMEANCTTIMDCEDSVAAVDAEDKARVYSNWADLMQGRLEINFQKNGKVVKRGMNKDLMFRSVLGEELRLPGRAVMLVRNVGIHMFTDAVKFAGKPVPEGILDAMITIAAAMHDLRSTNPGLSNSRNGSVYIVKPKLHGPEEAAFAAQVFGRVEQALGLAAGTVKIGVMDEERRTSANLKETMRPVADRVVFINTGFLDRTGDEIHTCMQAGPVYPKAEIKKQPWIGAYEDQNVDVGVRVGLNTCGQIGKGMWAEPDSMLAMVKQKIGHLQAGANTAWVPSPTAATLHALHYHRLYVPARQNALALRSHACLSKILTPPLLPRGTKLSPADIQREVENNAQGILGYMVRWIDQGVGCSKVPDINGVGLMEDRATLRISAQHIANWLTHKVVSEKQVRDTFAKMCRIVDEQNKADPIYRPMSANPDTNIAFQAALKLVLTGEQISNGYTEFVLTDARRAAKQKTSKL